MSKDIAPNFPVVDLHMDLSTLDRGVFGVDMLKRHSAQGAPHRVRSLGAGVMQYLPNVSYPGLEEAGVIIATVNGCPYPYDPNDNELRAPSNLWKEFRIHASVAEKIQRAHPDRVAIVTDQEGLDGALKTGRTAFIHSIEGLHLPKDPNEAMKTMDKLWEYGVRNFGLSWNEPNEVATPCYWEKLGMEKDEGLTDLGVEVVKYLDSKGAIIDASHSSDNVIDQTLNLIAKNENKATVVATHAGLRSITTHARNLPDALAKAMYIQGLPFVWTFVNDGSTTLPGLANRSADRVAAHAEGLREVHGGDISKIALGPDFGGTMLGSRIPGLDDIVTFRTVLYEALTRRDFSQDDIRAIYGGNGERHYRTNLPKAA